MNQVKALVVAAAVCGLLAGGITISAFAAEDHVKETIKHAKEGIAHEKEAITHLEEAIKEARTPTRRKRLSMPRNR